MQTRRMEAFHAEKIFWSISSKVKVDDLASNEGDSRDCFWELQRISVGKLFEYILRMSN